MIGFIGGVWFLNWKVELKLKIIVGAILLVFTVAMFLLFNPEMDMVHWVGLAFLLLSEFLLFVGMLVVRNAEGKYDEAILVSGIRITLMLYFIATVISILFVNLFVSAPVIFIIVQVKLFVSTVVMLMVIYAYSYKFNKEIKVLFDEHGCESDMRDENFTVGTQ